MPAPSADLLLRLAVSLGVARQGSPTPLAVGVADAHASPAAVPAEQELAVLEPAVREWLAGIAAGGYVVCRSCSSLVQTARFSAPGATCKQCGADLDRSGSVRSTEGASREPAAAAAPDAAPNPTSPTLLAVRSEDGRPATSPARERGGPGVPPRVGKQFERYLIREEISRGGMGVVFRAFDPKLNREVALKLLLAGGLASSEQVERFQREAKAAARLHHPNIVPLHEVGMHDGLHYLTMDYIRGIPLDRLLEERKVVPPNVALKIVRDVAYALHYAHHQGVVHRDVKPGNVILAFEESLTEAAVLGGEERVSARRFLPPFRAVITDFGLAKELSQASSLTESGMAMGTPHYMSPEQARGDYDKLDGRTDIYSLGVILYEMLTGTKPFEAPTVVDLMMKVVVEEPAAPRSRNPLLGASVETICLRAMAKERGDRYGSALELVQDVEAQLAGEEIAAQPLGFLYYALSSLRRNRDLALTSAVTAAIVLGVVVWFAWVRPWWDVRRARARDAEFRAAATERALHTAAQAETLRQEVRRMLEDGRRDQVGGLLTSALPKTVGTAAEPELWRRFGDALAEQGTISLALDAYAEAVMRGAGGEDEAEAWLGIAQLLGATGSADAVPLLERLLRDSPERARRPAALALLGRARLARFDLAGAADAFARARERSAGAALPPGVAEGEAWCRRLGAAVAIDLAGPAWCAAALPARDDAPARLFLGGAEGLFVVDGGLALHGAEDGEVDRLHARRLALPFQGVAALAMSAAGGGRPARLIALEWRGSSEASLLHVLTDGPDGLRVEQRVPVLPVAGPGGLHLRMADFDGDGGLEVLLASESPRSRLQAWRERAGVLVPWAPAFEPERLDLPTASLDVSSDSRPVLVEAALAGTGTWVREWRWESRRQAFVELGRVKHGAPCAAWMVASGGTGKNPGVLALVGPDGAGTQGVRTTAARERAGVALARRTAAGLETVREARVPQHHSERMEAAAGAFARRASGALVVAHFAAELPPQCRMVLLPADPADRLEPLWLVLPADHRCASVAAVDVDGDGEDELLLHAAGDLRLVGRRPWPAPSGTVGPPAEDPATREETVGLADVRPRGPEAARLHAAADLARLGFEIPARRVLEDLSAEAQDERGGHVPLLLLGGVCERQGDFRAALGAYNRALQGARHADPDALLGRARNLDRLGESATAIRELRDLEERGTPDPPRRAEVGRWRREIESRARFTLVVQDRFETAEGRLRLTSPFPYEWDRENFLLTLGSAVPEEHAGYFAVDHDAGGWQLEAEWIEQDGAHAPGYALGAWQGPQPHTPARGFRVRFVRETLPSPQAWILLEGGPGFATVRVLPFSLPAGEWVRATVEYHAADRRLAVRLARRAGGELASFQLPDAGEPMAGRIYAGLWVGASRSAALPPARIDVNYLKLSGDPARTRVAEPGIGAEIHHAHRLLVCGEMAHARKIYGSAAGPEAPSADAALAEVATAWSTDPDEAARRLAHHAWVQPTRLARAAERLFESSQDAFLGFLLKRWPGTDLDPHDEGVLAAAEERTRLGHPFEALAIHAQAAGLPQIPPRMRASLGWAWLRLGRYERAAAEFSGLITGSLAAPIEPASVDRAVRGMLALELVQGDGPIAEFLQRHDLHVQVRVTRVAADGAAARAGVRPGDRLVRLDRKPLEGWLDLVNRARDAGPGSVLNLRVRRGEEVIELDLEGGALGLRGEEEYAVGGR